MKEFNMKTSEDDLVEALTYNTPKSFRAEDVTHIVAEVPGANEELTWWWILKLRNGKFALLIGGCDYTGWSCTSGIEEKGIFATALDAAKAALKIDGYGRKIRENLIRQVKGKQPLFTYID